MSHVGSSALFKRTVPLCVVLACAGWCVQKQFGLPAGTVTGVMLSIPVAYASCSRRRRDVRIALALSGTLLAIDSLITEVPSWSGTAVLPTISFVVLCALGLTLRSRLRSFDLNPTRYPQKLTITENEALTQLRATTSKPAIRNEHSDQIELALLLFSMQDISRRLSGQVHRESLLRTVIEICEMLLDASHVRIYMLDPLTAAWSVAAESSIGSKDEMTVSQLDQRLLQWVEAQRRIVNNSDLLLVARQLKINKPHSLPHAIAPLIVGGEFLGLLVLNEVIPAESQSAADHQNRLFHVLANLTGMGLKNSLLFEQIRQLARRDGLTELLNHATFQEELRLQIDEHQGRSPVSIIIGDVDFFKQVNDTFGHPAGDAVLRKVAQVWQTVLPDHAILARYGGEEFVAILPEEALSKAGELAESLRIAVSECNFDHEEADIRITSSFGVASSGVEICTSEDLVRSADAALYTAKHQGRNKVVLASGVTQERRSGDDRRGLTRDQSTH